MFSHFESYLLSYADLPPAAVKHICSLCKVKKIRRRQLLLKEGEVCRHKTFITKGLFSTYRTKDDGSAYIMRFSPENTWAMDHESYNNQTPARSNIEALEDSEVMIWTKEQFEELFDAYPAFKAFSDRLKASTFDANQERILMNISYTSEEKYEAFLESFPDIFRRVPLHMVASYLGVSRETLSRIRHARVGRKE